MASAAEHDLAWDLAAAVEAALTEAVRCTVFAKIGAGETYSAIADLLSAAQQLSQGMPSDLLARTTAWLNAYAGSAEEPPLRELLSRLEAMPRSA